MTTANEIPDGAGTAGEARIAGIVLVATTLLSILMMAHHPSASTHEPASLAADIAGTATLSRIVHGTLIAIIGAELYAFAVFSGRLSQGRGAARAALVAYAIGAGAMIGAALISGFVVSNLGIYYSTAADPAPFVDFARVCMTGNQALAKLGVVAMSAAIVLWSIALLHDRSRDRWLPIVGFVTGLAPAIALFAGAIRLDVHGMLLVVVAQAIWNLAAGIALIRGRV
ncbi:MAG TPA: hypothetical protein VFL30_00735 [Rhodanobacteraceae bacterium]|nr:hypothetical protein [Rhodanobacteraceae bacterium]